MSKDEELALCEFIQNRLNEITDSDNYGIDAMKEHCTEWANAIRTDMPMGCYQRDERIAAQMRSKLQKELDLRKEQSIQQADRLVADAMKTSDSIKNSLRETIRQIEKQIDRY